ncbi:BLUF domain-containing protein [Aliiglaciecola sp. CAU 1673]|uniref:BLUF domain-containing protein n=1 Tax=Aliiglaciecola sp. CAU 1673 TaxID=3032595 RepID=UPI0023DB9656|nr:BLUF domain-containing protein [Aliiglaciecola sp. CAU 1673]MDF2178274.1 BLUF domain-containing protein [Aliiglaciecola sp. CAU 1673]
MYLTRLVYASAISERFQAGDIESILQSAKRNNEKLHVTGSLLFNRKYFLQCLEGPREALNSIFQKILSDQRHCKVCLMGFESVRRREFSNWSMHYIPDNLLTREVTLKYSADDVLNPFTMSSEGAMGLLVELSHSQPQGS